MSDVAWPPRGAPSSLERGILAAALSCTESGAATILSRLHGDSGRRCVREAGRWQRAATSRRAKKLAALIASLVAPVPAGIERIHPDWLEHAMAGVDQTVRRAITEDRPVPAIRPAAKIWLQRRVFAELVAMPAAMPITGPPIAIADLPRLPHSALGDGLRRLGAISKSTSTSTLAQHDRKDLVTAGSRALAPAVRASGGDLARHIAQRLPRAIGLRVLAELTGPYAQRSASIGWPTIEACFLTALDP